MRPPVNQPRMVRKKSRSIIAISNVRCAIVGDLTDIHYTDLTGSTAQLHIGNVAHDQRPINIGGHGGSYAGPSRTTVAVDEHLVNTDEGGLFIFHRPKADVSIGNPLLDPDPEYPLTPDNNDSGTYPTVIGARFLTCVTVSDTSMRSPGGEASRISIDRPKEFKTEFHPRSSRPDLLQSFEEAGVTNHAPEVPADEEPWRPFQSRGDFEFAEIAVNASLSKTHINALLDLISRVKMGQTELTLKNENDLRQAYDNAAKELTPVSILRHLVCNGTLNN